MSMVGPEDALEIAPILAPGSVLGGLHQANATQVPTVRVASALRRRLARLGVEVRVGAEARRALVEGGRVVGIETSVGSIDCEIVVNAAGASARALGLRNGVAIAAVPILESRFVTEPLPDLPDRLPMLLFFERDLLYLRGEGGGLLIGAIERALLPGSRVSVTDPPRTSHLSSHAVEGHERLARQAAEIMPVLARTRVARRASGLPTFTPDGRHIAGAAPGLDGYFAIAGCNESGVTYGPALGRHVAELAVGAAPTLSPATYRLDRFGDLLDEQLQAAAEARYLGRIPAFARALA
jgi:glycine/D-amino acid oxidase-like deaminating enzyme